jgi:avirulence protein
MVKQLAEIHYLLTQAAFDYRGSASRSELTVRTLAAAAGIELPPFKSGFVPDLESFMNSRTEFVTNYIHAFEMPTQT